MLEFEFLAYTNIHSGERRGKYGQAQPGLGINKTGSFFI